MTSGLAAPATIFFTHQLQKQVTQIADLVGKNQQAAADLNETLDDLDKRAAALQSQLGGIGAPPGVNLFQTLPDRTNYAANCRCHPRRALRLVGGGLKAYDPCSRARQRLVR